VNYETWLPHKSMQYPGAMEVVAKYQERAKGQKLDPLGFYLPPWAYAYLQMIEQAVNATKSLDDDKLADYTRQNTMKTVVGDIKFGPTGEWTESRFLQVQYQNIGGTDLKEFTDMSKQPILTPSSLKTGDVIYPFANARKK
jgi:branched-chain amino acid transport system substrate-binding protein